MSVLPSIAQCRRAFRSAKSSTAIGSAADFDGRVFRGDRKQGLFCRPICVYTAPAEEDERFFASAAAASAAGFVACPHCQPEYAPRCPDWVLGERSLIAAVRSIERQLGSPAQLGSGTSQTLAEHFLERLGATPDQYQSWQRIMLAKRLLDGTDWSQSSVALAAGMTSTSQLGRSMQRCFGATPSVLRQRCQTTNKLAARAIRLPVRAPYDAQWVTDFLTKRALPGLEEVRGGTYHRRLPSSARSQQMPGHWLQVGIGAGELRVNLPQQAAADTAQLLARVQQVFDAHADPLAIRRVLKTDPGINRSVRAAPGLRVCGAWDGFETTVRAILGQQVSVARARNLAIELIARFGSAGNFPTPNELVEADVAAVGMPGKRGGAVRALARAVLEGQLVLEDSADPQSLFEGLCALPGIGPWTAGYVSMRVVGDADAFPRADWVVLRRLEMTGARAEQHSLRWQPYRAYALMHIWRGD